MPGKKTGDQFSEIKTVKVALEHIWKPQKMMS